MHPYLNICIIFLHLEIVENMENAKWNCGHINAMTHNWVFGGKVENKYNLSYADGKQACSNHNKNNSNNNLQTTRRMRNQRQHLFKY